MASCLLGKHSTTDYTSSPRTLRFSSTAPVVVQHDIDMCFKMVTCCVFLINDERKRLHLSLLLVGSSLHALLNVRLRLPQKNLGNRTST